MFAGITLAGNLEQLIDKHADWHEFWKRLKRSATRRHIIAVRIGNTELT
jgi:hypothetical protein